MKPVLRIAAALAFFSTACIAANETVVNVPPPKGTATVGSAPRETVAPAFANPIANVPGKSLIAAVVTYPPGGKTPSHTHAKSAFITAYVLSGSIKSQVGNGPVKIYNAGESWSENPGDHHVVSENASATEPAKLLAIFVVDTQDAELTTLDAH
jgi:quercetin dioxygenase-like cupin family protein